MNKINICFLLLFSAFIFSCSNDSENLPPAASNASYLNNLSKDECLKQFSVILSKAVSRDKNIRSFIVTEARDKIDNGYNVFYPISRDKKVISNLTFRDILDRYDTQGLLNSIEHKLTLLNIHLPEYSTVKVSNIDVNDDEIPVLYSNKLYVNGDIVDSLASNEIPGFNTFVVTESSSIRKRVSTRGSHNELYLNDEYELVDRAFMKNIITKSDNILYESLGYSDNREDFFHVDVALCDAFLGAPNKLATRCYMYYDLKNLNAGNIENVIMRSDVHDCIFRFKLAPDSYRNLENIAKGTEKDSFWFFKESTSNYTKRLTRETVISQLLTGRAFCLLFEVERSLNNNVLNDEKNVSYKHIKIYATPEKLFNLGVRENRRHPTMFRHTKYTYTIDKSSIRAKWYYPLENGHDTRLDRWDIINDPISKRIVVFLLNPDEGATTKREDHYEITKIKTTSLGAEIAGDIKKIKLGVNGKLDNSNTVKYDVTTEYEVTLCNEFLAEFYINYFNDYPIETMAPGVWVLPSNYGNGPIEISVLPITNSYFNSRI